MERFANVLTHCDEVVICNALMPVLPVQSIQMDKQLPPLQFASRELFEYLFCAAKFSFYK